MNMEAIDTKVKILKGTEELFMKYGVRSVTMDNVANHLGVSKKTLYQFFKDKDELVFSVTEAHIEKDREQLISIAKEAGNAVEELVKLSTCLRQNLRDMNPSLLFDLQKYHHSAWNLWLEYKNHYIKDSIVRSLNQGKEEGFFRTEANTEILAISRLETIQLAFDPAIFPPAKYSITEVQMQLFEHFVYGVLTDKGRKLYQKYKEKLSKEESALIAI